ncbi:MAG: alpha,alpha-trehalase TreF [Cytophagaceae bacterium]|nr:alpha,alpha-trehalase TreF [Cytophagaceae bacterium]
MIISEEFSSLHVFRSPEELYGELFIEVQRKKIFHDYKTFVDCIPLNGPEEIMASYQAVKESSDFDLTAFVFEHFKYPDIHNFDYQTDITLTITQHIESLWSILTRRPQLFPPNSSLMVLPHSYVIPGGRFIEIFYWDSYFIMLGLTISGKIDLLQNMIDNFCHQLDTLGFIPNGNRTYFLSRSQPPVFAMMVQLLIEKDPPLLTKYLPYLEKEYQFWMNGSDQLRHTGDAFKRVVKMPDGEIMNRYWDDKDYPRPESYGEDLSYSYPIDATLHADLYRNVRAACESGWDFSTRWYKDQQTIQTIHTIDIVPVDLNCLLHYLEDCIAKGYELLDKQEQAQHYRSIAEQRKNAILKYFWNNEQHFFMDYDSVELRSTPALSLAAVFPLYFNLATTDQANEVTNKLQQDFLKDGGLITTLKHSEFQWDSPNGWAPLQWIAVKGLLAYDKNELAYTIADRWMKLNEKIYHNTGKLMEKYNVVEMNLLTGGGEYPLQDGFGWTNGVYLGFEKLMQQKT